MVCLSVIVKRRKMTRPRPPKGCRAIGKKSTEGKLVQLSANEALDDPYCTADVNYLCSVMRFGY
jgi:hypothetical protein